MLIDGQSIDQTEPILEERVKAFEEASQKLEASSGKGVVEPVYSNWHS